MIVNHGSVTSTLCQPEQACFGGWPLPVVSHPLPLTAFTTALLCSLQSRANSIGCMQIFIGQMPSVPEAVFAYNAGVRLLFPNGEVNTVRNLGA